MQPLGTLSQSLQPHQRLPGPCTRLHPRHLCSSKPQPAHTTRSRDSHVSSAHLPHALRQHHAMPISRRRCSKLIPSASSGDAGGEPEWEKALAAGAQQVTNLFPLWVVIGAVAALIQPSLFNWIPSTWITWLLAGTMLGMGLTMQLKDFSLIFSAQPWLLCFGLGLQYTVMPCLGFLLSRFAGLDRAAAIGITLLSSCPGGTASNIVAYMAKGDLGLSIMMTTASTFTAIFATPLLTQFLAGALVPVNAKALFMSTLQVVLAPVLLGVGLNGKWPGIVSRISKVTPAAAALLVALIVATTLAHSAEAARQSGAKLLAAVFSLHSCGFAIGYGASRLMGLSEKVARTNSIEVGMQNSTLGAVLAALHFNDPLVAVPCAISACTHSVLGSLLAAFWRDRIPAEDLAAAKAA